MCTAPSQAVTPAAFDSKKSTWGSWPQGPLRTKKLRGWLSVRKMATLSIPQYGSYCKNRSWLFWGYPLRDPKPHNSPEPGARFTKLRAVCVEKSWQLQMLPGSVRAKSLTRSGGSYS